MAGGAFVYIDNTNNLVLSGLKLDKEETYLNDGVQVTVTVKDADGNELSVETNEDPVNWPMTMSYISESNGDYIVGLTRNLLFTAGQIYTAVIEADASDTETERFGHWEFPFTAKVRTK